MTLPIQNSWNLWRIRGLLLAITLLVGVRVVGFDYVDFDDPWMFIDNPHIKSLSLTNLHWMFTDNSYNNFFYTPLLWFFYALSISCLSLAPQMQHIASLVLHMICSLLVFEILHVILVHQSDHLPRASRSRIVWAALLGSLIWALHPLRVETYGWISARVHLHASLFAISAVLFYCLACVECSSSAPLYKKTRYWMSVLCFGLSMLCFPTATMLPLALGLMDIFLLKTTPSDVKLFRRIGQTVARMIPFVVIGSAPTLISLINNLQSPPRSNMALIPLSFMQHVAARFYVLWHYLGSTFLPMDLSPAYTTLLDMDLREPVFTFGIVMTLAISVTVWILRRRYPALVGCWLIYIVMIALYAGITGRPLYASDRYCYLGSIVTGGLLACTLLLIWQHPSSLLRYTATSMTVILLLTLAIASIRQLGIWRDSFSLFQAQITRLGDHPYRSDPMWRMAACHLEKGQLQQASFWIQKAWAIRQSPRIELIRLQILTRQIILNEKNHAPLVAMASGYTDFLEAAVEIKFEENRQVMMPAVDEAQRRLQTMIATPEWLHCGASEQDELRIRRSLMAVSHLKN